MNLNKLCKAAHIFAASGVGFNYFPTQEDEPPEVHVLNDDDWFKIPGEILTEPISNELKYNRRYKIYKGVKFLNLYLEGKENDAI